MLVYMSSGSKIFSGGYSLIELAVVLSLMSVIGASAFSMGRGQIALKQQEETMNKLSTIEEYLEAYLNANGSLPCPGPLSGSYISSNFGAGSKSGSSCTGVIESVNDSTTGLAAGDVYKGVVPIQDLGLPKNFAIDGWGRKIEYIVQKDFISEAKWVDPSNEGKMYVYQGYNDTVTPVANDIVYVLMSHGKSGHGAYPQHLTTAISTVTNNAQRDKYNADSVTGTTLFIPRFISMSYNYSTSGDKNSIFDDILIFKKRWGIYKSRAIESSVIAFNREMSSLDNVSGVYVLESGTISMKIDGISFSNISGIDDVYSALLADSGSNSNYVHRLFCKVQTSSGFTDRELYICSKIKDDICSISPIGAAVSYKNCVSFYNTDSSVTKVFQYQHSGSTTDISGIEYSLICLPDDNSC